MSVLQFVDQWHSGDGLQQHVTKSARRDPCWVLDKDGRAGGMTITITTASSSVGECLKPCLSA